jgi:predicted MPP superfamily phosphohydrolase
MSWTRYLIFFLVVSGVTSLLHGYLWWRFVSAPGWPAPWQRIGTVATVVLALSVPLSFVAMQSLPRAVATPLIWLGYVWMGLMFFLFVGAVAAEPVRAATAVAGFFAPESVSPDRRLFVLRALALVTGAGALGLGAFGMNSALSTRAVKRVPVRLRRGGAALHGLRIVQITDVHIGPTLGRSFLQAIVDRINTLDADIVAITGDLIDGSVEELGDAVSVLGQIKAKHGVYFVTGNHEYYSGADSWLEFLRSLGIRTLRNERVSIELEGGALDLVGVDDWTAHQFGGDHGADLERALRGRDESRPSVLLAHQPKAFPEAAERGIDLQLSGHTHGGQMKPFHLLTKLDTPFVHGLYSHGTSQLYVSPGTGFWGPPMRVGVPAEITEVVLSTS